MFCKLGEVCGHVQGADARHEEWAESVTACTRPRARHSCSVPLGCVSTVFALERHVWERWHSAGSSQRARTGQGGQGSVPPLPQHRPRPWMPTPPKMVYKADCAFC